MLISSQYFSYARILNSILGPFGRPEAPSNGPTNDASAIESSFGPDIVSAPSKNNGHPRTLLTGSDDVSVLLMQTSERLMTVPCGCHRCGSEHGDPAPERPGMLCKGVEWREPVSDDGSDEGSQIGYQRVKQCRRKCGSGSKRGEACCSQDGRSEQ